MCGDLVAPHEGGMHGEEGRGQGYAPHGFAADRQRTIQKRKKGNGCCLSIFIKVPEHYGIARPVQTVVIPLWCSFWWCQ